MCAPPGHRAEAGAQRSLVAAGPESEPLVADRASGRGGVGLGLGGGLAGLARQFPGWAPHLGSKWPRFGSRAATNCWMAASRVTASYAASPGGAVGPCGRPHEPTGADRQVVFMPSFYPPPAFTRSKTEMRPAQHHGRFVSVTRAAWMVLLSLT